MTILPPFPHFFFFNCLDYFKTLDITLWMAGETEIECYKSQIKNSFNGINILECRIVPIRSSEYGVIKQS